MDINFFCSSKKYWDKHYLYAFLLSSLSPISAGYVTHEINNNLSHERNNANFFLYGENQVDKSYFLFLLHYRTLEEMRCG